MSLSMIRFALNRVGSISRICQKTTYPFQQRFTSTNFEAPSEKIIAAPQPNSFNPDSQLYVSPSDFNISNVFTQGIPFFSPTGMFLARVQPATFKRLPDGRLTSSNPGLLRFTFYPKLNDDTNKFDTVRSLRLSIRGVDIGSLLEIDSTKITETITVPAQFASLDIVPVTTDIGTSLTFRAATTKYSEDKANLVEVPISTGQFVTLQTILKYTAPSLFGWQVLLDPRLASYFMLQNNNNSADYTGIKTTPETIRQFFDSSS